MLNSNPIEEIKVVARFICPETGKEFRTEQEARTSADNIRRDRTFKHEQGYKNIIEEEIARRQNYIKANLENPADLERMIKEKAKEFWNIDFNCSIKDLVFEELIVVPAEPKCFVWRGKIVGVLPYKGEYQLQNISDIMLSNKQESFLGFHYLQGYRGVLCEDNYKVSIEFRFFLDDFPRLKEKHDKFLKESEKYQAFLIEFYKREAMANNFANTQSRILDLEYEVEELKKKISLEKDMYAKRYLANNILESPILSRDFSDSCKMFGMVFPKI